MKNTTLLKLTLFILLASSGKTFAFSPYENFLLSDKTRQVGLIAAIPDNAEKEVTQLVEALSGKPEAIELARSGITDVSAYRRTIKKRDWIVLHFKLDADRDYLDAAKVFAQASESARRLTELIEPHPRATRFGTRWLQMEWINYIRGKDVPGNPSSRLMIVTTIIPEKEQEYRSLHQTVWPGVVDQLIRSNNRDLCIFLAEIEGLLVEFLYVEHVGHDQKADDEMSQTDAINHRWWKLTDACQKGLPSVDGNWTAMDPISSESEKE